MSGSGLEVGQWGLLQHFPVTIATGRTPTLFPNYEQSMYFLLAYDIDVCLQMTVASNCSRFRSFDPRVMPKTILNRVDEKNGMHTVPNAKKQSE